MVSNVTFAQEKPTAALAPMGSLGELDEIEKRIIFNSLQESLSKYYTLTSQKMYEKAEEEAFLVMDADECTEDQCIAIIQEFLQVEYFFMFEILQPGNFQQMKITRVDIDGNRDVRTTTCEDCNISKTNSKVDQLVQTVSEEFKIQQASVADIKGTVDTQANIAEENEAYSHWDKIKYSEDKNKYKEFIKSFPNSSLKGAAQSRLDKIIQNEKNLLIKRIAEQKKLEEEKKLEAEKQKRWEEASLSWNKELVPYWDAKKCKPYDVTLPFSSKGLGEENSGFENFFAAENLIDLDHMVSIK